MRKVVVLPAPLGPSRPVIWPSAAWKLTPLHRLHGAGAGLECLVQIVGDDHACPSLSNAAQLMVPIR
ncbi:hypothetical protein QE400_000885 [Xanthomonas sacchari]|nr:hypothetical protein [Xanthomonas sacchari]